MQHEPNITDTKPFMAGKTKVALLSFSCETGKDCLGAAVENLAAGLIATGKYPRQTCEDAQVVLAEVINNIAEHGYRGETGGKIQVNVDLTDQAILIETLDFGVPMPGFAVPPPTLPTTQVPRSDLPEGGFGWYMIHALAPSPQYLRRGNTNILRLRIS